MARDRDVVVEPQLVGQLRLPHELLEPLADRHLATGDQESATPRVRRCSGRPIGGSSAGTLDTGQSEFHGFGIAKEPRDGAQSQGLIAHGTLCKALSRLETGGLLESSLEDPDIAADQGRPRRRLYRITGPGRLAAAAAIGARPEVARPGWYPGIELA